MSTGAIIGIIAGIVVVVLCLCGGGVAAVVVFDPFGFRGSSTGSSTSSSSSDGSSSSSSSSGSSSTGGGSTHTVTYRATSSDGTIYEIEYDSASGVNQTASYRSSPWSTTESIDSDTNSFISMTVRNNSTYDGAITCSISVDGTTVSSDSDSGSYLSAYCSTTLS